MTQKLYRDTGGRFISRDKIVLVLSKHYDAIVQQIKSRDRIVGFWGKDFFYVKLWTKNALEAGDSMRQIRTKFKIWECF